MNIAKSIWQSMSDWVNRKSLRERTLLFGIALTALAAMLFFTQIDPVLTKQKRLRADLTAKQNEVQSLGLQVGEISKKTRDPDADNKTRRDALLGLIGDAETGLKRKREQLIAPENIPQLLEDVLSRQSKLTLVELRSLPPEPLFAESEADGSRAADVKDNKFTERRAKQNNQSNQSIENDASVKQPDAGAIQGIYRHGIELTVRGGYMDLLAYLAALEKLPVQLYWKDIEVSRSAELDVTMKVTLFTVNFNRIWLAV